MIQTASINKEVLTEYFPSNISGFRNRLIHGDNLIAMEELLKDSEIAGKIRLVYIDPPYATNQNFTFNGNRTATISRSHGGEIAYSDTVTGDRYIEFLRERLILLKELMSDDGSIYVHSDYKIGHYVKVLMDEVFGADRFINDIARIKCNPKNFSRRGFGNIKDMILFYSKSGDYIWNEQRQPLSEEDIIRLYPKVDDHGRRYTTTPLHAPGETKNGATGKKWKGISPPEGRHWRYPPDQLDEFDQANHIEWSQNHNPRLIIYADDAQSRGKKRQDIWEFKDPQYPDYPTEKNFEMMKLIIESSSNPNDIVLDCFAGSGTTILVAESLNRRWIAIDNSAVAINLISKRRHLV